MGPETGNDWPGLSLLLLSISGERSGLRENEGSITRPDKDFFCRYPMELFQRELSRYPCGEACQRPKEDGVKVEVLQRHSFVSTTLSKRGLGDKVARRAKWTGSSSNLYCRRRYLFRRQLGKATNLLRYNFKAALYTIDHRSP